MDKEFFEWITAVVSLLTAVVGLWQAHVARQGLRQNRSSPGTPYGIANYPEPPSTGSGSDVPYSGWPPATAGSTDPYSGWPPSPAGACSGWPSAAEPEVERLPPTVRRNFVIGKAMRDGGFIFLATFVGGLILGAVYAGATQEELGAAIVVVSIVMLLVGFTISAVLAFEYRWKHLAGVAAVLSLLSLINVVLGLSSFEEWVLSAVWTAVLAAVGGAISLAIRRR